MVLSAPATTTQLGLLLHAAAVMTAPEIVGKVEHLRSRHETGLLRRQVGREVLMKLRRVEISEIVCRLLYRTRLAQVTWEALPVVSLVLSRVGHVRRDVYKTGDG